MERSLMKGNEALAEAAIRAGCKCFFGYPITPQTELSAYMAKRMEKSGGVFLQAESEIAAINMVLGAASTGVRAMTSSSSPGVSLKAEGISYMAGSDLPGLIINVQRGGPGLGSIQPAQSDYNQATHAMGHGDFHILVYAPCSVQEMVDTVTLAFDKADQYRMPAMILADGLLGQMMEPVTFPEPRCRTSPTGLQTVTATSGNTTSSTLCIWTHRCWRQRYRNGSSVTPLLKKPKPMQNCTAVMMRRSSLPLMVHLHVYPSPLSLLPAARASRQVCAVPRPCGRSRKKNCAKQPSMLLIFWTWKCLWVR